LAHALRAIAVYHWWRSPAGQRQMDEGMLEEKNRLRAQIVSRLAAMFPDERDELSTEIAKRFVASLEFRGASVVLAYDSFGTEVNTHPLMQLILERGKALCLPKTRKKERSMTVHAVADLQRDLTLSRWGFLEPKKTMPVVPLERIDLIIVPGLAFDPQCHRLGRGAGYYDRFLPLVEVRAAACALAFECQIVEAVPVDEHDWPLQLIFTEERVIHASAPLKK